MNIVMLILEMLKEIEEEVMRINQNLKKSQNRRKVMPTTRKHTENSKWVIMCTSRSKPRRVP
jgi:hypothetical protein